MSRDEVKLSGKKLEEKIEADLLKLYLLIENFEKKKIIFKDAVYEKKRVTYITGKDFEAFVKENSKYITDEIHAIFPKENLDPTHKDFVQHVFDVFHDYKIMTKAQREADDKKKYPKKLLFLEDAGLDDEFPEDESEDEFSAPAEKVEKEDLNEESQDPSNFHIFDNSGFYIIIYEKTTSSSSLYFYLILVVCAILAYTLLPIWPLEIKIFIWWVSYIFLLTIIGIVIKGVIDSFKPILSYNTKPIGFFSVIFRLVLASFVVYTTYVVYFEPTLLDEAYSHVKEIVVDVFGYVENKIIHSHNGTQVSILHNKDKFKDLLNDNEL